MQTCWSLLDLTSRSFAAVIKELKGEMSRVICLFYLALRALDTIEDDMTLDPARKVKLLTSFYRRLEEPGWTFTESESRADSCRAWFARRLLTSLLHLQVAQMKRTGSCSSSLTRSLKSTSDWEVGLRPLLPFCRRVVGEGLSRLFSESGVERAWLGDQLSLSNHMGLFLQKTNIIRDYAEDCAEGRHFWPKECWAAPGADFASQADVAKGIVETSKGSGHYRPEGKEGERAMFVLSTMLLDAVRHSTRALDYLSLLREQSIFNFCAIPQVMAIATLNVMMGNPDVFRRNVKIRKSQAVQLILRTMNPRDVSYMFLEFAREMRTKLSSKDPNFVKWSIELSKVSGAGNRRSSTGKKGVLTAVPDWLSD
ncbi:hypothetical protein L7F22_068541 [Adiantum nelumboides]|nr:hypothetical protein [Adiantum nelumboides]